MLVIDPLMHVIPVTNVQRLFRGPSSVWSRCYSFEQTQHCYYGLLLISHMCYGLFRVMVQVISVTSYMLNQKLLILYGRWSITLV